MKAIAPILLLGSLLLASCGGDPGHFDSHKGPQRSGTGNAPLEGPTANDVINDVHHDRARQHYEDRSHRRYYGSWH